MKIEISVDEHGLVDSKVTTTGAYKRYLAWPDQSYGDLQRMRREMEQMVAMFMAKHPRGENHESH